MRNPLFPRSAWERIVRTLRVLVVRQSIIDRFDYGV